MINKDKKTEEIKILLNLMMVHCVNYNTFLVTLIVNPIIVIVSVYLMLQV